MDPSIECASNGATWIRDCLIDSSAMSRALDRLRLECRSGLRHFSALGIAVPLEQVRSVESDILRLEAELDSDRCSIADTGPLPEAD